MSQTLDTITQDNVDKENWNQTVGVTKIIMNIVNQIHFAQTSCTTPKMVEASSRLTNHSWLNRLYEKHTKT